MQTMFANGRVSGWHRLLRVLSRTRDVLLKRPPIPARGLKFYLKWDEKLL